jgi:hypothetical protein
MFIINNSLTKKAITLRKRRVLVNKVLKGFCVRANPDQSELGTATFRANISFLDRRPFAKREIVSNVYSVQVPMAESGMTRVFKKSIQNFKCKNKYNNN